MNVHLEELVLRIPGLDAGRARAVGEEVARRIALRLAAAGAAVDLGALDLRLQIPAGTPLERVIDRLVDAITARIC